MLRLDVDTVIPLGLMVNELVSNALKHAWPGTREGVLSVSLRKDTGQLLLTVSDNGIGMNHDKHSQFQKSFGFRMIKTFAAQLKAELDVDGDLGTTVRVRIGHSNKVA